MPPEPVPVELGGRRRRGASRESSSGAPRRPVPEWAHSVHVELRGLAPDRWYWYRFRARRRGEPRSAARGPRRGRRPPLDRLRFAFASCQHYEQGYFAAYRHMLADDLDLVLHLGDYIYEVSSLGRRGAPPRGAGAGDARRLPEPPRPLQDAIPTSRPRTPRYPWLGHLGRPRGRQRLRQRPLAGPRRPGGLPAAPGRRLPGLLRAHAAPAPGAAGRAGPGPLPAAARSATSSRSTCWTGGSTATTSPAARPGPAAASVDRGLPRARRPDAAPCSAPRRSPGSSSGLQRTTRALDVHRPAAAHGRSSIQQSAERPAGATGRDGWDGYPAARGAAPGPICGAAVAEPGGPRRRHPLVLGHRPEGGLRDPPPTVATEFVGTSITSPGVPYRSSPRSCQPPRALLRQPAPRLPALPGHPRPLDHRPPRGVRRARSERERAHARVVRRRSRTPRRHDRLSAVGMEDGRERSSGAGLAQMLAGQPARDPRPRGASAPRPPPRGR